MYIYKQVKKLVAVKCCPKCEEELIETGNRLSPFSCPCGAWIYDPLIGDYTVIPVTP